MSPDLGCLHPTAELHGVMHAICNGEKRIGWNGFQAPGEFASTLLHKEVRQGTEVRDGRCVVLTSLGFATVFV
jgi:hypothetical protein